MREAMLSLRVRAGLRPLGGRGVRLEETGEPGIADLLLFKSNERFWFLELKVEAPLRPEQRRWLNSQWLRDRNAFLLKASPGGDSYRLWTGATDRVLVAGQELWSNDHLDLRQMLRIIEETTYGTICKSVTASRARRPGGPLSR